MQACSSRRALGVFAVTVVSLGSVTACNVGGTDVIAIGQVRSVTFAAHTVTDTSCRALGLQPVVDADASVIPALVWSSSDSSVALPDSTGQVLALAPGSARIRAWTFLDTTKFDTVHVTVVDPAGPFVTVSGVNQSATGQAAQLGALHDSVDVVLDVVAPGCRRTNSPKWVRADVIFTGAQDTLTQTFAFTGGIGGAVMLRVNTAQKDSATSTPLLPNGSYMIGARVTDNNGLVVSAPSVLQATVANP